jgi:hypothetical protein
MKKVTCLIVMTLATHMAFAGDDSKRNETRVRTLGASLIGLSACSEPTVKTEEYDDIATKADGISPITNKDGSFRYVKMTRITATSAYNMNKCLAQEKYMVEVTGSMWNTSSSEIPGSSQAMGNLETKTVAVTKSQEVNLKKLVDATNGGGSIFDPNDGAAQLILNLAEGLKNQAKSACEAEIAELSKSAVARSQTACR